MNKGPASAGQMSDVGGYWTRAFATVAYPFVDPVRRWIFRGWLREAARTESVGSFTVAVDSDSVIPEALEKLRTAIGMLEHYSPERYHDAVELIPILSITERHVRTQYICGAGAVLFPRSEFDAYTPVTLASLLVHESCHARLERRGVPFRPWSKRRIEAVCVRAEYLFLRRVPGAEDQANRTRQIYFADK